MRECEICKVKREDKYFNDIENKCILHTYKKEDSNFNTENFLMLFKQYIAEKENPILIKINFPELIDIESILNKSNKIQFIKCTFNGEVELSNNMKLRFSMCTFNGEWTHIICEKIVYSKCNFDKFIYSNIGKEKDISKDSTLFDCTFNSIDCEGIIFLKPFIQIVDEKKTKHIDNIKLARCEFEEDFILKVSDNSDRDKLIELKINSIDLTDSTFHKKFKMQCCSVENESIFYNTKFKDLADFYRTKFNEVVFERTDFEKVSVFSEVEFNKDIDFKYAKFLGKSIFRDTVIKGELNLRNAIFADDANFLDITSVKRKTNYKDELIGDAKDIRVSNRETARIIKNFYDSSNNIIEANKFYALEMRKREYELKEAVTEGHFRFIFESFIFKIHGITSNHSQDWFLSLLWILNITFMYSIYSSTNNYHNNMLANILFYIVVFILFIFQNPRLLLKIIFIIGILIFVFLSHINLDIIAMNINPFSIMTSKDPMTFGLLLFKITIAYLIYQFIVSVRQNTRRK